MVAGMVTCSDYKLEGRREFLDSRLELETWLPLYSRPWGFTCGFQQEVNWIYSTKTATGLLFRLPMCCRITLSTNHHGLRGKSTPAPCSWNHAIEMQMSVYVASSVLSSQNGRRYICKMCLGIRAQNGPQILRFVRLGQKTTCFAQIVCHDAAVVRLPGHTPAISCSRALLLLCLRRKTSPVNFNEHREIDRPWSYLPQR